MAEKLKEKLESFVYVGLIPMILILVLLLVLMSLMGIPVWNDFQDWGKSLIAGPSQAEATKTDDSDAWKQKYFVSNSLVKEKDQKIAELTKQVLSGEKDLLDYKINNEDLKNQLNSKISENYQNQLQQIANVYSNMPETKAASILESMPLEDASLTISTLDPDQQSSILSSMDDTEKAAEITMMLKDMATLNETDVTSLKEQIHQLALKQENPAEQLTEAMGKMTAVQSAGIIQSLMETNSTLAITVLKNISTDTCSQILTELAKKNAKLAEQIASSLNN